MKKKLAGMMTCAFLFTSFSIVSAAPANDKDCSDFANEQKVQEFWQSNGYSASNDPHNLDRDSDGLACEGLLSESSIPASEEEELSQSITVENPSASEASSTTSKAEQGEPMPDTASNGLLVALLSTGLAGIGFLFLLPRKKKHV